MAGEVGWGEWENYGCRNQSEPMKRTKVCVILIKQIWGSKVRQ